MARSDVTALRNRIVTAALCVPLSTAVFAGCAKNEATVPDAVVPEEEAPPSVPVDEAQTAAEGSGTAAEGSGETAPPVVPPDDLHTDPPQPEDPLPPPDVRIMEGRALTDGGEALVAPSAIRGDWQHSTTAAEELPHQARIDITTGWATDASFEHASIASFARAAMELMALGAPPDLIRRTQLASIDEIAHAEAAYALATMVGGAPLGPGALPLPAAREVTAAAMARWVFEEGCLGESIATLVAMRQRNRAEIPEVIDALDEVVNDEAEHAALAWDTLDWLLSEAPEAAEGLRELALSRMALYRLAARNVRRVTADHHRWGRLAKYEIAQAADEAVEHIVLPLLDALLG